MAHNCQIRFHDRMDDFCQAAELFSKGLGIGTLITELEINESADYDPVFFRTDLSRFDRNILKSRKFTRNSRKSNPPAVRSSGSSFARILIELPFHQIGDFFLRADFAHLSAGILQKRKAFARYCFGDKNNSFLVKGPALQEPQLNRYVLHCGAYLTSVTLTVMTRSSTI